MSSSEQTSYVYDAQDRLRRVVLPDSTQVDYVHDALGRRVGKVVDGSLVYGLRYGTDSLRPLARLDGSGVIESTYVYGTRVNVPELIVQRATGAVYRVITDHLGSVRLVVEVATGAVAQRMEYDEFGVVLEDTNPGFQPFGFAGGLYDADTGLVRFGARDYDAVTGRWTAKDPILFEGGTSNLYEYVNGDPVNRIDPTGHFAWAIPIVCAGGGCAAAAATAAAAVAAAAYVCLEVDRQAQCYATYLDQTAYCGETYPDDHRYDICMANAWKNYIRCINGLPPGGPLVPR